MQKKVVGFTSLETRRRHLERQQYLEELEKEIPDYYQGDIERYLTHCELTAQSLSVESFLDYLYVSIRDERLKKSSWERRLAAIKKYLSVTEGVRFAEDTLFQEEIGKLRKMYKQEEYNSLEQIKGKSALPKEELYEMVCALPTREKAICLVNLVTANRPSEMVRMKIEDFDFEGRSVSVRLVKQKKWHHKRLTQDVVKAVREYVREYNLQPSDYLVGRTFRGGGYDSREVTVRAYHKLLDRTLGLSGYNFRKTQVASMHEAGADLSTIAKQTGHQSVNTLSKHYLSVSDTTVDKYL